MVPANAKQTRVHFLKKSGGTLPIANCLWLRLDTYDNGVAEMRSVCLGCLTSHFSMKTRLIDHCPIGRPFLDQDLRSKPCHGIFVVGLTRT